MMVFSISVDDLLLGLICVYSTGIILLYNDSSRRGRGLDMTPHGGPITPLMLTGQSDNLRGVCSYVEGLNQASELRAPPLSPPRGTLPYYTNTMKASM